MDWSAWAGHAVGTLTMTPTATDGAWVALFAEGGTYQDPVTTRTTDVASVFAITRASFPDWEMTVTSTVGDEHGGAIEWVSQGHLPHGPAVSLHGCSVITLDERGQVVRWRDYFDLGEFERQAAAT
ncbi:MAG TPA: nuclear transport factor 2 family protein [Acidimicrobiales bacterium]|jgi:limonene-1,2-epoxide hydrolase|nr:nuclear transport factor 2 family protein [Acidimicrobiales bacterium]